MAGEIRKSKLNATWKKCEQKIPRGKVVDSFF